MRYTQSKASQAITNSVMDGAQLLLNMSSGNMNEELNYTVDTTTLDEVQLGCCYPKCVYVSSLVMLVCHRTPMLFLSVHARPRKRRAYVNQHAFSCMNALIC